jgi:Flp pilus assembly protein TadB
MIRYNIYFWFPPILTPEEEIEAGRQIAIKGREWYLSQTPYLNQHETARIENARTMTKEQKFRLIGIGGVFFGLILFTVGAKFLVALLVAMPILALIMGSLYLSRRRYHRWVDDMIAKYAAYAVAQPKSQQPKRLSSDG